MSIGWIEDVVKDGKVVLPGVKSTEADGSQVAGRDMKLPKVVESAVSAH
jgi:hypothetical protein